jgi:hypothetical protein
MDILVRLLTKGNYIAGLRGFLGSRRFSIRGPLGEDVTV